MHARPTPVLIAMLAALTAACSDAPEPTSPLSTVLAAQGASDLGVEVAYYFEVPSLCANAADVDADGDWSFPAPLAADLSLGASACLTAEIMPKGNKAPSGYILWEMCGEPGSVGPKADCDDTGVREWSPRTGEVWTELDPDGTYTTSSQSIACSPGFGSTVGFRYRYSPVDPTTHPSGDKRAQTFSAFDVTADDRLCSS